MGTDLKGKKLPEGIRQKENGSYVARYQNRFGKRPEFSNPDINLCIKWLKEERAKDLLKQNIIDETVTMDEYFDRWINVHKQGVLKKNTYSRYTMVYDKYIKPTFGKKKLSKINRLQVKDRINELRKEGYQYETIRQVFIMIKSILQYAADDGLIGKNCCTTLKVERDEKKEPRVLTIEEEKELLTVMSGTFYYNLVVFMLGSGLRPGECYALNRSDINFEENYINVNKTLIYQKWEQEGDEKKTFHLDTTKTHCSVRKVPLTNMAKEAAKNQFSQKALIEKRKHTGTKQVAPEFKDLLFTTQFNTPICTQILVDCLKKYVNEINLTNRDECDLFLPVSPHTMRHTFATRCLEAGIEPKIISNFLGHATVSMTLDLYVHATDSLKKREAIVFDKSMKHIVPDNDNIIPFSRIS